MNNPENQEIKERVENKFTRIRYVKEDNNVLVSKYPFVAGTTVLSVRISTTLGQYVIVDLNANKVVQSGDARTLNKLKIAAKKALIDLGVQFYDEKRNRVSKKGEENE